MNADTKKKYKVNRHFQHNSKVYSPLDQPEFTDKEAKIILDNQNPKPDGKRIKPLISLLVESKPATAA